MRRLLAALSVGVVSLCGCGTTSHFQGDQALNGDYYAGVSTDLKGIKDGRYYLVPDLALSAVADTLLIPWYTYCFATSPMHPVPPSAPDQPPATQSPTQPVPSALPFASPELKQILSTTSGPPASQPSVAPGDTGNR